MSGPATEMQHINSPERVVRKIIVYYEKNYYVYGFQFLDIKNTCVLQIGRISGETTEILLAAEDRIVGLKSKLYDAKKALHCGLVFVIGRPTS